MDVFSNKRSNIMKQAEKKLRKQTFKLFKLLYENRIREGFVTAQECRDLLWPEDKKHDHELQRKRNDSIRSCIREIRKFIGQDGVENDNKSGYRLVGIVHDEEVRLLTAGELMKMGISAHTISAMIMRNDRMLYKELPAEVAGEEKQWTDMYIAYPHLSSLLFDEAIENIIGNFSIHFLDEENEMLMHGGNLKDSSLQIKYQKECNGQALYLLNLSVNEGVDQKYYYKLWEGLVDTLKKLAEDGVFFKAIYYKAFTPRHALEASGRGFNFICKDRYYGDVYMLDLRSKWDMERFDRELSEAYQAQKSKEEESKRKQEEKDYKDELLIQRIIDVYDNLMGQLRKVFDEKRELTLIEPYFNGRLINELPQKQEELSKGLGISWLYRDIFQYTECFLPYLSDRKAETYWRIRSQIMGSALVKYSMKQYQFRTERETTRSLLKVDINMPEAIWLYAKIWIDLDILFIEADLWEIKKYYYEKSDELPMMGEQGEKAIALTIRILTAMSISEDLFGGVLRGKIPHEYIESYFVYKENMYSSKIVKEVFRRYPFLKK